MSKSKFILLFSFLIITNCKSKKELDFNLLNNSLQYAAIFSPPKDSTELSLRYSVYDRYSNKNDWVNSLNSIKFKISNNTNEKIFLPYRSIIINQARLDNLKKEFSSIPSDIYFEISDSLGKPLTLIMMVHWRDSINSIEDLDKLNKARKKQMKKDSLSMANTPYKSYLDEKRLNDFKILNPNEDISISTRLSLPIPIDYENVLDYNYGIPMYAYGIYKFKLHCVVNKKDIEENIPQVILDSLKKEGVFIKDILLSSEEINVYPNPKND